MGNRNEELCIREVKTVDRVTRMGGGRMRPVERAYFSCLLVCGHVVEKLKSKHSHKLPIRMACPECRRQKAELLDVKR